jgi:nitrite reductase (NADH) large subunit
MRIVVVGAGPAGTRVSERAATQLPKATVVLLGEEPALPYDRVALGRVLAREAEAEALITHDRARLAALGIHFRPAARVTAIDRAARAVITARGECIAWDRLVLATGARAVRLPIPGAELPSVFLYRTIADVHALRRAAADAARTVVIGGGLLGLEAAASLAQLGCAVTVLHAVGWPMERQLDPTAGAMLARVLGARRRIRFVMPATVAAIEGEERVTAVRLADGRRIAADLVLMTVGVRPETALARAAGLAIGRGIMVDDAMRSVDPQVLAVGECAEHRGAVCGLAAPALAMAETAAATLAGEATGYRPRPDAAALKVSGLPVWSAGEIAPLDAEAVTLEDEAAGRCRNLWLRGGRLVGAVLVGDTADAPFYLELIETGRDVDRLRRVLAFGPAHAAAA